VGESPRFYPGIPCIYHGFVMRPPATHDCFEYLCFQDAINRVSINTDASAPCPHRHPCIAASALLKYTFGMATYVKPWADIFIRYLFGRQANEKLLLSFTNAVLEDSGIPTIVVLEIKKPFNLADLSQSRRTGGRDNESDHG